MEQNKPSKEEVLAKTKEESEAFIDKMSWREKQAFYKKLSKMGKLVHNSAPKSRGGQGTYRKAV